MQFGSTEWIKISTNNSDSYNTIKLPTKTECKKGSKTEKKTSQDAELDILEVETV